MNKPVNRGLAKAIVLSWLLVGTLDILAAIIQTVASHGSVIRLLQYIASGVFGKSAFEAGWNSAALGLAFHYAIALGWTVLFFLVYRRLPRAPHHRVLTGIGYGLFVWVLMNRVVLPVSNVQLGPFVAWRAALAAGVLVLAIGLPLSFLAARHFGEPSAGTRN